MKKILVVLLIFAVTGGVFAQWSVDGDLHLETTIDFYNTDSNNPAWIEASGQEDGNRGELNLMYNRDGLSAGFGFNTNDGITAKMAFQGANYWFAAEQNFRHLLNQGGYLGIDLGDPSLDGDFGYYESWWDVGKLEGTYSLLNGILNFHAAYRSGEYDWWLSDGTALGGYDYLFGGRRNYGAGGLNTGYGIVPGVSIADGFAYVDGNNFFKVDISFSALNFGIILPNAFYWGPVSTGGNYIGNLLDNRTVGINNGSGKDPAFGLTNGKLRMGEGVLKMAIFGVSFDMNPIDFALQLAMEDFGAYLGVGFQLNERMKLGVSFAGLFANWYETNAVGGLSFDVNFGAFGAGVKAWYGVDGAYPDGERSTIGVEPSFFYNIIPTHFRFAVDGLFAINAGDVFWRFSPEITWNFRGQGAGEWGDIGTGFLVRLNMEKEDDSSHYALSRDTRGTSNLLFAFKWNFF